MVLKASRRCSSAMKARAFLPSCGASGRGVVAGAYDSGALQLGDIRPGARWC